MGNTVRSNIIFEDKIVLSNWEKIDSNLKAKELIKCDFISLRNKINGKCIDRYLVQFKNQEDEKFYKFYKFYCVKRVECPNLVEIFSYKSLQINQLCLQTLKSYVYIEHIPLRLSQIKDIPFNQNRITRILRAISIEGFFEIEQDLFCFNYLGKCKVWLNPNLSANEKAKTLNKKKIYSQQTMVKEIIRIIEANTKYTNSQSKIMLSRYFKHKKVSAYSFDNIKFHFKIYCQQFNILIPRKCNSVLELYKQLNTCTKKKLSTNKITKNQSSIRIKPYTPNPSRQMLEDSTSSNPIKQCQTIQMEESTKISIIWQENAQNKYSQTKKNDTNNYKPLTSPRIRTLADDLHTQSKTTFHGKSVLFQIPSDPMGRFDEKSSKISYLSLSRTSYLDIADQSSFVLNRQFQFLKNKPGCLSQRNQKEIVGKCKYNTLEGSISIDSLIAQDLLKYI